MKTKFQDLIESVGGVQGETKSTNLSAEDLRSEYLQKDVEDMQRNADILNIADPVARRAAMDAERMRRRREAQGLPSIAWQNRVRTDPETGEKYDLYTDQGGATRRRILEPARDTSPPSPFQNKNVGDVVPLDSRKGFKLIRDPDTGRETWVPVESNLPGDQAGPPQWKQPTPEEYKARREQAQKERTEARERAAARKTQNIESRWKLAGDELTAKAKLAGFTDEQLEQYRKLHPTELEKAIRIKRVKDRKDRNAPAGGRIGGGFGGGRGIAESYSLKFKPNALKKLLHEQSTGAGGMGGGESENNEVADWLKKNIEPEFIEKLEKVGGWSQYLSGGLKNVLPFISSLGALATPPEEAANTALGRVGALGQSSANMEKGIKYYNKLLPRSAAIAVQAMRGDPRTLAYYQG